MEMGVFVHIALPAPGAGERLTLCPQMTRNMPETILQQLKWILTSSVSVRGLWLLGYPLLVVKMP